MPESVETNYSPCMEREGSRFESSGTVGFAAPWEEAGLNDVERAHEAVEITVDVEWALTLVNAVVGEQDKVVFCLMESYIEQEATGQRIPMLGRAESRRVASRRTRTCPGTWVFGGARG